VIPILVVVAIVVVVIVAGIIASSALRMLICNQAANVKNQRGVGSNVEPNL
jgi:hypothetical protein